MVTTSPSSGEGTFIEQLRALASKESVSILGCLASHKPTPVPVHVISAELGMTQRKTSGRLAKLRSVKLIAVAGRRKGYFADTAQIKAVIGTENYTRIIQELHGKNENTPGQS